MQLYKTIYQALDHDKEIRAVICDISKAFDRVWHAGLIHKLAEAGLSGAVLSWFRETNKRQKDCIWKQRALYG